MKRHLQTINILIASSLLLCLQQHHHCDAAPTFARRRRAIAIRKNDDGSILSTPSSTTGYVNFKPRASSHNNNKPFKLIRGGDILLQSTTLITTIVGQALNIAMAALVTSGYVGCYIASFLIRHLQFYCNTIATTTTTATAADAINSSNNDFTLQNYKWTILATLTHILLNLSNNNILASNPTFLPTLWAYSHYINPTLGGYIGCTHLVLGGVSSLLGSKRIVDNVSDLMKVRLPPLDEDGNMSYNVDTFQKEEGGFKNGNVLRQVLVRILSSCSIFTSFPRDMLSLYMGTSALLTFILSLDLNYDNNGMLWKKVKDQIPWWRDGLFGGGGTGADMVVVDTREVTMRLFVMHWIVMVVKGTTSALVLQR